MQFSYIKQLYKIADLINISLSVGFIVCLIVYLSGFVHLFMSIASLLCTVYPRFFLQLTLAPGAV